LINPAGGRPILPETSTACATFPANLAANRRSFGDGKIQFCKQCGAEDQKRQQGDVELAKPIAEIDTLLSKELFAK
jgi:hypothetical protein